MFTFKTTLTSFTLSLLLATTAATAQDAPASELDQNDDGQLSFVEIDTDGDNALDEAEMEKAFGPAAQRALAKFDADADGTVTKDEVRSWNNAGGNEAAKAAAEDRRTARAEARAEARGQSGNGNGNGGGNGNGNGNGGNGGGNGNGNR